MAAIFVVDGVCLGRWTKLCYIPRICKRWARHRLKQYGGAHTSCRVCSFLQKISNLSHVFSCCESPDIGYAWRLIGDIALVKYYKNKQSPAWPAMLNRHSPLQNVLAMASLRVWVCIPGFTIKSFHFRPHFLLFCWYLLAYGDPQCDLWFATLRSERQRSFLWNQAIIHQNKTHNSLMKGPFCLPT